ncbi:hypothetical protein [Natronomonas sp. EA1]|uniref:hypothetical protein n=1 Tax=Natronomonas sp. EA1 TaxID=3421655 RepID=UPI003EBEDC09
MYEFLTPMQLVPSFGLPGILSTLIIAIIALVVLRFVLNIALKIAVIAGIVVAVLWFFGLLRFVPFLATGVPV